jgi:hypothetical protein
MYRRQDDVSHIAHKSPLYFLPLIRHRHCLDKTTDHHGPALLIRPITGGEHFEVQVTATMNKK